MSVVTYLSKVGAACVVALAAIDLIVRFLFPVLPRFETNFSRPYLHQALSTQRIDGKDVFLGDSALWGYKLESEQTALHQLLVQGYPVVNLSFEGGSIANTYAMLKAMIARGSKPALVVFNVNVKEFNAQDSSYNTLYPALEREVWQDLDRDERAHLKQTQKSGTIDVFFDQQFSRFWMLYGMRADIRNLLFGEADAATAVEKTTNRVSGEAALETAQHAPTAEKFLGTYDLMPLTTANAEVYFLKRLGMLLEREHIRSVAILTPTNHGLLHDYIDVSDYQDQLKYVTAMLERSHVRVLNYDNRYPAASFIDNDHLNASAQAAFASDLRRDIAL